MEQTKGIHSSSFAVLAEPFDLWDFVFRVLRVFRGQLVDVPRLILSNLLFRRFSFLFFQEIRHFGNLLVADKASCFCAVCCDHESGRVRRDGISLY